MQKSSVFNLDTAKQIFVIVGDLLFLVGIKDTRQMEEPDEILFGCVCVCLTRKSEEVKNSALMK